MKSIYFSIPHEGMIRPELARIASYWISPKNQTCKVVWGDWPQLRPIDLARNHIVEQFLKSNCSHLLMVDSDMIPPPNFIQLAHIDQSIIGGLCPISNNRNVFYSALRRIKPPLPGMPVSGGYKPIQWLPENTLLQVDVTGTGCILIQRQVLETMVDKGITPFEYQLQKGKDQKVIGADVYISEDFYFCEKASQLGYKTFVHTGFPVSHIKNIDLLGVLNMMYREKELSLDKLEMNLIDRLPFWATRYIDD